MQTTAPANIADNLRAKRLGMGLSQARLAKLTGLTQSQLCRWERGIMPEASSLSALATALHTTTDALLGRKAKP